MSLPLIGIPVDSAGVVGGTELAPTALRRHGLVEALGADDRGDLVVSLRGSVRDPDSGLLSASQVEAMTTTVRRATADLFSDHSRLFAIGGCCSIVPGILAGARDAGRSPGLVLVDGHLDLYDGSSSELGEAADMPVTVGLGLGPQSWVAAAGGPSLTPERVVIIGYRDGSEAAQAGSLLPDDFSPPISALTTDQLRARGLQVGELVAAVGPYWVHLDLDVVDPQWFFANDAPVPGGLDWSELAALISKLFTNQDCLGLSLGCYNPEKDPLGRNAEEIVAVFNQSAG